MGARDAEFSLDDLRADVKKQLDRLGDQLKEHSEKAMAQAKAVGDMYAADKPKIDEMLTKQGELQARMAEIEKKQDRRGEEENRGTQTAGQMLVGSDGFKAWLDQGGRKRQSAFVFELPHAAIISTGTTNTTTVGVAPDVRPGVIPGTERRLTVRDLIAPGSTDSNLVQYVRETGFTNNAAPVSEGDKKPESTLTYELVQSPVTTLAHFFKASKQILDDFAGLRSMIDQRGRYGLKLVEENQLLLGSGVGNNLNGIYTQATAYSAPFALPAGFTKIDVIRLMLLQAELAEYPSTGIVMHPSDWAAIELTKDANRGYIFANPQSMATPRLWGRPVVATQAMAIDTALVGAFQLGAQIFDREEANVVISTENEDDFVRNMITIRVEERLALAVYRPAAFVRNANLPAS
jgi:HK97 family phage major capsid protein